MISKGRQELFLAAEKIRKQQGILSLSLVAISILLEICSGENSPGGNDI